MARNGVAANLLMFVIVVSGLVSLTGLVQEAFPVLSWDLIEVSVPYPGATPEEVEQSIVVKIEEQVGAVDGVKEVSSVAAEGVASVMAGLVSGADAGRVLDDIESAVSRIRSFPVGAERPEIREMTNRQSVIRLIVHGDVTERALKQLAHRTEDQLASLPEVSYVETSGVRNYEIAIEVPASRLRALGLTLADVSEAVRRGSLDLSAGSIETRDAVVRVRTTGQSYDQQDFEEIVVLSREDGTALRLGDIAKVRDGFQDVDLITRYNGQRAAFVEVYRSSGQQVRTISDAVENHLEREVIPSLPPGTGIAVWNNDADAYTERFNILVKNGVLGLLLILVALALFLEVRLAIWVAVGIGVSVVGTLTIMLFVGASISSVSLAAFILAIGLVVDDAIVVAEQIHRYRQTGAPGVLAAIRGVRRIQRPLVFAVLTSVAAFFPLLFIPGAMGDFVGATPVILISVLIVSLIESLFVLPHHLSHLPGPGWSPTSRVDRFFSKAHARVDRELRRFVEGPLDRALRLATDRPAVVLCGGASVIVVTFALFPARIIDVALWGEVTGDIVAANLEMPEGTPARRTNEMALRLERAGLTAVDRLSAERPTDAEPLLIGVSSVVGLKARQEGGGAVAVPSLNPRPNIATVEFKLLEADRRDMDADVFLQAWREEVGPMPEARGLTFTAQLIDLGFPIHMELSHPDSERLGPISDRVVQRLSELPGVFDVRSDHVAGFQEVRLELRPEARALGLTLDGMARQMRSAFFGVEALRVQRGREDIPVYVRPPAKERDALADLERYHVRVPSGASVPLSYVASARPEHSASSIHRRHGRRVVTVTANVDAAVISGGEAVAILETTILPDVATANPGFTYTFGGQQQQQAESFGALGRGFLFALLAIYVLVAIPLRSYTKPVIVMSVIPFGVVGAILGHLVLGVTFDLTSFMGVLGLSGVVVNDSIVMIDSVNQRLRKGDLPRIAIIDGAKERFRPIFLTSVTTCLGFTPLILERAVQARFLIPFAASVGVGILFATAILMVMIPALTSIHLRFVASRS